VEELWWGLEKKLHWERWGKNLTARRSLRTLEMQVGNRNQGSRLIKDTFPLHFLLPIKLSRVIRTRSQWRPWENPLNFKVFLSSPLGRARFFPHLSSRAITRVFSQALIIDFSKKLKNYKIFGGVSNLVFIVHVPWYIMFLLLAQIRFNTVLHIVALTKFCWASKLCMSMWGPI
jgi:hypothetical protein